MSEEERLEKIKERNKKSCCNEIDIYFLLNLIEKQQKEIKIHKDNFEGLSADITQVLKDLGLSEETIIADEMVVEIKKKFVSKDKIIEMKNELNEEFEKNNSSGIYGNDYYIESEKYAFVEEKLNELLEE